jgi:hypothetical protein
VPEVAHELCLRAGSKAYIAGTVGGLGNKYVLGLKAVNCQSGDMLAQEQVTAASKEKVLDTLGEAASKLRSELGESLATVQKFDAPLLQATTSSLEALQACSLGNKARNEKGPAATPIPIFPSSRKPRRSTRSCSSRRKSCLVAQCLAIVDVIRWDEKAGLRRDTVGSQVIDVLEAQEIKETGNEEG